MTSTRLTLFACSAVLGLARAAETTPAAETVKLNPFVVSESDAVGYSAASTLAGTRINTALRDVGAAISIITPEFLQDTAATNLGELLSLTTSTEIGGVAGNFAGGGMENGRPDMSESRENPQANNRVRGIGAATTTRNYFPTDIPFDAYNSSGVTINRGPNSLLYGASDPGGIINYVTKRSAIRNATGVRGTTSVDFGSYDFFRGYADVDATVVPGKLGIRVPASYTDQKRPLDFWHGYTRAISPSLVWRVVFRAS